MCWARSAKAHSCSWKRGWTGAELGTGRTQDPRGNALDVKEWSKLAAGICKPNVRFWVSCQADGTRLCFDTGRKPGFGQTSQQDQGESRKVGFRNKIVLEGEQF